MMPQRPPNPCTAVASTGSSMPIFLTKAAPPIKKKELAMPITMAAHVSILSQAPVTATNPTKMPLHKFPRSNLLVGLYVLVSRGLKYRVAVPAAHPPRRVLRTVFETEFFLGT